jgi:hypothetical protein
MLDQNVVHQSGQNLKFPGMMQTGYYFDQIVTDSRNVKLTGYLSFSTAFRAIIEQSGHFLHRV